MLIYADGSCRGNPGPMAIGVSIQDNGKELETISTTIADGASRSVSEGTNNVAEYRAAIEGLRKAYDLGATDIELRMDSELVVRQILGQYKVRSEPLQPLHAGVMACLSSFKTYRVVHIPRDQNARADELANRAYRTTPRGNSRCSSWEYTMKLISIVALSLTIASLADAQGFEPGKPYSHGAQHGPLLGPKSTYLEPVRPNAYGSGINADAAGRAFQWQPQGALPGVPDPNLKVTPNKYGLGVHADQYGRIVEPVSPWP